MKDELPREKRELPKASFLVKASHRYGEKYPFRAIIQGIPILGGPLDTLLAGAGANWQSQRFEAFIQELSQEIDSVRKMIPELGPDEPLYDFIRQVFDEVISHRSAEKRQRFVHIVTRQLVERHEWEEAETAARFLGDLTERHVAILNAAVNTPICSEPYEGLRVITFIDWGGERKPDIPPLAGC